MVRCEMVADWYRALYCLSLNRHDILKRRRIHAPINRKIQTLYVYCSQERMAEMHSYKVHLLISDLI